MNNKKGITLIALVVTIVVLLILAAISLNLVLGKNGIITKAGDAQVKQENAEVKEAFEQKIAQYDMDKYDTGKLINSLSDFERLKNDYIVYNEDMIDVKNLLGVKLKTGNGTEKNDAYEIENNELCYYNKNGEKIILSKYDNINNGLQETDQDLFSIDDQGVISLKYKDDYMNGSKTWNIENLVIPTQVDGKKVNAICAFFMIKDEYSYNNSEFNSLKNLIVPNGVKEIGKCAFEGCKNLKAIYVPNDIIVRGKSFNSTKWYDNQPDGDIYIGKSYYYHKGKILSLCNFSIKEGTFNICSEALSNQENIQNIETPDSLKEIEEHALYHCIGLEHINLSKNLEVLEDFAFYHCDNLNEINLPNGLKKIGVHCFWHCENIETITIPNSVEEIGINALRQCYNLKNAIIEGKNIKAPNFLFSECHKLEKIEFGEGITEIGELILQDCPTIKTVKLPKSLTKIDDYAFENATTLEQIVLPDNLIEIGTDAFYNCISIKNINIPSKVKKIGTCAFYRCLIIETIDIPENVTEIGAAVFEKCDNLKTINVSFKENELPSGWNSNWKYGCNAVVNYK